ncbi:MAG TPA: sigma-70 family RNA polymerase sigma factor [Rhodanobacteraceae bacterium]|jgi:RNA polymerase sigma-70 factor (ECF subfamily)
MTATWVSELAQQHLDAAYNLGRWLLGNEHDAADAVHDAYLRAARSAHTYAGGNARAWWLAIVRNACLAALANRRRDAPRIRDGADSIEPPPGDQNVVETSAEAAERARIIERHLRALPAEYREVLILREIEDLSYREIADVLAVPIGTVMSRLSRARAQLQKALSASSEDQAHGL